MVHDLSARVASPELRLLHVRATFHRSNFDLSEDDGVEPDTSLRLGFYTDTLERWKPLYKWFLAIRQYIVLTALCVAACAGVVACFFAVLVTGEYPQGIRTFLVSVYRYGLRVEAYVDYSPIGTRRSASRA